jgi:hypothetical protein
MRSREYVTAPHDPAAGVGYLSPVRTFLVAAIAAFALPSLALASDPTSTAEPAGVVYRFGGYLRLEGAVVQNDPAVAFIGRNDGFRLANARMQVDGRWKERLAFRLSADGADDERAGANATGGALRFALKDAYADVRLSPLATIRSGQFYPVFDVDEIGGQSEQAFVDRALESRGVSPTEGWETAGLAPGRSLGVALRSPRAFGGETISLGYELASQNGNGEDQASNDNDALAYSGAVVLSLGKESVAYVGARHNRRTVGELPFREVEEDVAGVVAASLFLGPVHLAAQAIVQQTTFPTTKGLEENAFGAHAQAQIRIPAGSVWLAPGYRFAVLEPSDLIDNDQVQEHTAGLTVGMDEFRTKLLLNVTHVLEEAGRELENDRVELLLQVSL